MCNKITFNSKKDANEYIWQSIINNKSRRKPVKKIRAYKCLCCGDWHLTSQSKAQSRRNKRKH